MAKAAEVTVRHGTFKKLLESVQSARNLEELGRVAVDQMRLSLERGISPIRGERRLENYSESYSNAIKKGWLEYAKNVRPVNLILSGNMIAAIDYKAQKGLLEVGIWDPEMAELAGYHQDGTKKMPARRFVPTKKGESFTVTIDRALLNKLKEIINRSIR